MKPVNRSTPINAGSSEKTAGEPVRQRAATDGRWLPVLARLMTLYQPIIVGLLTSRTVDSLAIRGREVLVLLLVRVLVTAFGVAAGLALRRHHARGVGLAKVSLLLSGATELFIVLTPSFPNSRGPGETPIWVAGILIYFGGWLAYLMRSPDP
ncbi:MAG: hypothetical protein ABW318_15275 [Vicinamibacterales bacterium]|jgi:hypothetical protein